ncbi:nucleolar complex protein 3 [Trifolium medium]|uniref:Nucleolar complex protein 3 n=1 Tax=Trifolium medium TaxID=97028 RepID=A0A392NEU6_9FABA|nr:nucleolar complex protein 3 [Trifolium medium]
MLIFKDVDITVDVALGVYLNHLVSITASYTLFHPAQLRSVGNFAVPQLSHSLVFTNEGKRGEATVEAVRLISYQIKDHNCQLHPDSVEVAIAHF